MLQSIQTTMPETAETETQHLRAEIRRMADMVAGVVRQTAIEGISAAMTVAASGTPDAPIETTHIAGQLLERTRVMQNEIDRFLSIAAGRSAA